MKKKKNNKNGWGKRIRTNTLPLTGRALWTNCPEHPTEREGRLQTDGGRRSRSTAVHQKFYGLPHPASHGHKQRAIYLPTIYKLLRSSGKAYSSFSFRPISFKLGLRRDIHNCWRFEQLFFRNSIWFSRYSNLKFRHFLFMLIFLFFDLESWDWSQTVQITRALTSELLNFFCGSTPSCLKVGKTEN